MTTLWLNWQNCKVCCLGRRGRLTTAAGLEGLKALSLSLDMIDASFSADVTHMFDKKRPQDRTLIHTSGLILDKAIVNQRPSSVWPVFASKAGFCTLLDSKCPHGSFNGILIFSSISGLVGSPGQSNYASANKYLDSWCAKYRDAGYPSQSIAWGGWKGVGMAKDRDDIIQALLRSGLGVIEPSKGLDVISRVLSDMVQQIPVEVIATPFNMRMIQSTQKSALFENYTISQDLPTGYHTILKSSNNLKNENAHHLSLEDITREVDTLVDTILGHKVPPEEPLMQAGLDSFSLTELNTSLSKAFKLSLSSTFVFDHPTKESIVDFINNSTETRSVPVLDSKKVQVASCDNLDQGILSVSSMYPSYSTNCDVDLSLSEIRDPQGRTPIERWDIETLYHPDFFPGAQTIYVNFGSYLQDTTHFDLDMFKLSAVQGANIDPQHRMILEECDLVTQGRNLSGSNSGAA